MSRARADAWVIAGLTAVTLGFFWRWLAAPGDTLYSEWSEVVVAYNGWKTFMADAAAAGTPIAFWNPNYFGGTPAYANPQALWLHPLHVLFHVLPVDQAIAPTFVLFFLLIGAGTHVWLRLCGLDTVSAAVGALAGMIAPRLLYHVTAGFLAAMAGVAMLPWIFAATEYACRRSTPWRWGLVALALSVQLSSGFVQLWLYTGYGLLVYVILRPAGGWLPSPAATPAPADTRRPGLPGPLARALALAGAYVGSLVLGAHYFWPAYELQQHTLREAALDVNLLSSGSLAAWHWLTAVVPQPWGSPNEVTAAGDGQWQLWDHSMAFGVVPLLLACAAGARRHRRLRYALFAVLAVACVLATGPGNPLLRVLYWLPGMSVFRFPSRFLFIAGIAVSGLAATSVAAWTAPSPKGRPSPWPFVGATVGLLALVLWLRAPGEDSPLLPSVSRDALWAAGIALVTVGIAGVAHRTRRAVWVAGLLAVIMIADSARAAGWTVRMQDPAQVYPENDAIRWLRSRVGTGRVADFRGAIHPGMPSRVGLQTLGGYDPMQLAHTARYFAAATGRPPSVSNLVTFSQIKAPRLFALFGARWALSIRPMNMQMRPRERWKDLHTYHFGKGIGTLDGYTTLYEYPPALPRAFVVGPARQVADADEGQALLRLEPRDTVLLAVPPPVAGTAGFAAASITRYTPNTVSVRAVSDGPGYLVLTDAWYPAWTATRNGSAAPVLRANGMFRAVPLPAAGEWTVEFRYRPRTELLGAAVSGAGVLGLVACGLWDRRRYSKSGASSSSSSAARS